MDNTELGHKFREHYIDGLRRLVLRGKLRLEGEWFWLQDSTQREAWLDELTATVRLAETEIAVAGETVN